MRQTNSLTVRLIPLVLLAASMYVPAARAEAQSGGRASGPARGDSGVAERTARPTAPVAPSHWRKFAAGFVSSILFHESAHIATAIALGAHPTFGFDKLRPTVYSGLDFQNHPHDQFLFSVAGLASQTVLDELLLDIPHSAAGPFERGVVAGGLATTLFYLTIGRAGYVSDVEFMARVHGMTKTQSTLLFGSVAAVQMLRIHNGSRYPDFFVRPAADGRVLLGLGR